MKTQNKKPSNKPYQDQEQIIRDIKIKNTVSRVANDLYEKLGINLPYNSDN